MVTPATPIELVDSDIAAPGAAVTSEKVSLPGQQPPAQLVTGVIPNAEPYALIATSGTLLAESTLSKPLDRLRSAYGIRP